MYMKVTIQQIADVAGVSRGTVDRALNHRGRINPEVAEMIQKTADELGYVHKQRKRTNGSKKKKKIGVITQLSKSSFMLEVLRGIQTAKKEMDELNELLKEDIDGLAIMPVESEKIREKLNWLITEKGIPVITFNSDIVGTKRCCFVGMNNSQSGRTAAGLFHMLTKGIGKILIVTGYFSSPLNNARVDGFVEELKVIAPKLEIAGVQGSFNDSKEVEKIIENAMMNISGINGIYVVSGGQSGIREAFGKLRMDQRPYVLIYDQTAKNEKLLKDNIVDFLIDQNGFEQGYRPVRLLFDLLVNGVVPKEDCLYTGINIKTKYNL